jgi:hypothetical protein
MSTNNPFPLIRIHPAARERLGAMVNALRQAGRPVSMTRLVSDLILAQPIPNNGHQPVVTDPDPTGGEGKVKP